MTEPKSTRRTETSDHDRAIAERIEIKAAELADTHDEFDEGILRGLEIASRIIRGGGA